MGRTARIIAIDPSINHVGWCVNDRGEVTWGTIRGKGTDAERLASIRDRVLCLVNPATDTVAAIEKPPTFTYSRSTSRFGGNGLNASALQKLNMAYGVILEALASFGIDVETVLPEQYKPKVQRGRMVFCLSAEEVLRLVRFQFEGQSINEHEAHAIFLMQWKERRLK